MKRFLMRLLALSWKEALHIARDPWVTYLALIMPVVLLFIFGYAVTFDLDRLPVGWLDQDHSPASRRLAESLVTSGAFSLERPLPDVEQIEREFRSNQLKAALVVPPGFSRALARGAEARAQVLLDGSDGVTTGIALGYMNGITQALTLRLLEAQGIGLEPPLSAQVRLRFNPEARSAVFLVPGLISLILTLLSVLLTALAVAREWERGSMEQLFATPVGRLEIVAGKLLPYVVLGLVQLLLVLTMGAWLFDVPVRGSLWLLFWVSGLFLAGCLGQGLLISVVTRSQQVATQFAAITAMLPTVLLSGFLFPIENMPWPLQLLSYLVPARYFNIVLRGVLLKGNGLETLWPQVLALLAFAVLMMLFAVARFRRRLD